MTGGARVQVDRRLRRSRLLVPSVDHYRGYRQWAATEFTVAVAIAAAKTVKGESAT